MNSQLVYHILAILASFLFCKFGDVIAERRSAGLQFDLKSNIAKVLGIEDASASTQGSDVSPPLYLQDAYDSISLRDEPYIDSYAVRGNGAIQSLKLINESGGTVLVISMSGVASSRGQILGAELVLVRSEHWIFNPAINYFLDITDVTSDVQEIVGHQLLSEMDTFSRNFEVVNITSAFKRWLLSPNVVRKLEVKLKSVGGEPLEPVLVNSALNLNGHNAMLQPTLIIYNDVDPSVVHSGYQLRTVSSGRMRRAYSKNRQHRRMLHRQQHNSLESEKLCSLRKWYISFQTLGMDQILKPDGFYANYCSGDCRHPIDDQGWNATNHAWIRNLYRHNVNAAASDGDDPVPDATCIATKLSTLSVLYKHRDSYVLRLIPNVTAAACGCA